MTARVAVVHLGREASMGQKHRIHTWLDLAVEAGFDPFAVPLLADCPANAVRLARGAVEAAAGVAVPEAAVWSPSSLARILRERKANAVILVTIRAWHPSVAALGMPILLDHVDELSRSYRQRAALGAPPHRRALNVLLGAAARRLEQRLPPSVTQVAAGRQDAERLHATWIPILAPTVQPPGRSDAEHDVVFFGNLSYPPNSDALDSLAAMWPEVIRRRPGTTLLVAGRHAERKVRRHAAELGWELVEDFASLADILKRARCAAIPLRYATGIQNKALEAAAYALAQIVTPAVMAGLDPAFPVEVSELEYFPERLTALLDDDERLSRLGDAGRRHVLASYSASSWAPTLQRLLAGVDPVPVSATVEA